MARTSMLRLLPLDLALLVAGMAVEGAGGRELAELVADRVLRDEHRDELAAVVNGEGEADHLGRDRRSARPGLDDPLLTGVGQRLDLLQQMAVDEWAFLDGACHAVPRYRDFL